MLSRSMLNVFALVALFLNSCAIPPPPLAPEKDYSTPLPPGQHALRKITDPAQWPTISRACIDRQDLLATVERSISYMEKPSSKRAFPRSGITHEHAWRSLQTFRQLLRVEPTAIGLESAIKERFDVYTSVGCDNRGTVLFTGYYTPIFAGSRTRSGAFQFPLYQPPPNLVKTEDGLILGLRDRDFNIAICPARADILKTKLLAGRELLWLDDPFSVYIAHVQGSAKVKLPDGQVVTVGYAGCNGRPYRSVALAMVRAGKIKASEISLATMIRYFQSHPDEVTKFTNRNPRFVFFKDDTGDPRGSLNEPVTTRRTIATDKSIFPPGAVTMVVTQLPRDLGGRIVKQPTEGFALDQDTGGAIRAPGRCDIYLGCGDEAGKLAGWTREEGRLYYFFLK